MYMNHTANQTNIDVNPWVESSAMVYVALTVATFSAATMCCVWFFKKRMWNNRKYNSLDHDEEQVELRPHTTSSSDDEVDIPLVLPGTEPTPEAKPPPEAKLCEVFTIEGGDSGDSGDSGQDEAYEEEHTTSV